MARRTPQQIYADLTAAGFPPAAAVTMTQIALAESGGDPASLGDVGAQTAQWGPSVGVYQIRTLKAETGKGTDRDIMALTGDPARQALAAYRISGGGKDFHPWSAYNNGSYQRFASTVASALGTIADAAVNGAGDGPLPTWGPSWLPWNIPSNIGNAAIAQGLSGARNLLIEALFIAGATALVGVGLVKIAKPYYRQVQSTAAKAVI
jgi:hypothetical protein